jgi:hypothetical protein
MIQSGGYKAKNKKRVVTKITGFAKVIVLGEMQGKRLGKLKKTQKKYQRLQKTE